MVQKSIVIISNTSWSIYNFRFNLAKKLKERGFDIICIAPKDKYSDVLIQHFEYYDIYIDNKGINPINDIRTLYQIYKLYKKIQPDVVLNFTIKLNIYSSIVARFMNISTISNITGLGTVFIRTNIITKLVKLMYRISLKSNKRIFFQNNNDKDLFIQNNLVNLDIVDTLPGSGVDLKKFKPTTQNYHKFSFLFIGRLLKDKGILEYIEAIKIIKNSYPNVLFKVVGDVDIKNNTTIDKKQLDLWVNDNLINYHHFSNNIMQHVAESSCIVLPSYREGMSRALLEAASMEKPLIATDVPGCRDAIDDGINGFLCRVKDSQDLANKMKTMLKLDENERRKMGEKGREKMIKEFDEKIVIDKYFRILSVK